LLLLILLAAVACGGEPETGSGLPRGTVEIGTGRDAVQVDVEIAETYEAKVRGLMGRRSLPPENGMVFLAAEPTESGFWMKDTLIPLSIAFWDEDGRILAMLDMAPCESEPCPTYNPGVVWTHALEVNQGFFDEHGVELGDPVQLER
jgi:uncharacterized membrane protein (UPF0127 family)